MADATRRARSGARKTQTRVSHRLGAWWAHHRQTARESLNRLLAEPVRNGLTMLMLAIALALPALLLVALNNIGQLSGQWSQSHQMTAYLMPGARDQAVQGLVERWQKLPSVAQVKPISPQQGLTEFADSTGLGALVTDLSPNPLPWAIVVTPEATLATSEALAQLKRQLSSDTLVQEVRLDFAWVERLRQLMVLGQRIALGLALLLALGMLLAIGNTLRLAIENRRDEILVVKLVGGTDAFVRRPFLYMGLWYGLGGGLLALVLTQVGLLLVSTPVAALASAYNSQFSLQGLGFSASILLLLAAMLVGWAGAWLAVGRHLRDIQPR